MKPLLRRWISPWPALAFSLGGLLLGMWLLPARPPNEQLAQPSSTNGVPVPLLPPQRLDDDGYRADVHALFAEIRGQARAARETPDVAALLTLAAAAGGGEFFSDAAGDDTGSGPISVEPKIPGMGDRASHQRLHAEIDAMTPAQCWWVFQHLLLTPPYTTGRVEALGPVVESLLARGIKGQPEAIARSLAEQAKGDDPGEVRGYAVQAIDAWGHAAPRAAADFVSGLPVGLGAADRSGWEDALGSVCKRWYETDPANALAWIKALPDTDVHKVCALEGVFAFPDQSGLEAEKACVERMVGLNKVAPRLAAEVAGALASTQFQAQDSPQTATQWALSLSGLPERREALGAIATVSVESLGVRRAARWAATLPPDEARGAAWASLANEWEACDASGQPNPVGSLDEAHERIRLNAHAVNGWLASLPAGADRDAAIAIHHQWEDHSLNGAIIWR